MLERRSARERLGITEGVTCVLWVGGLVPVKQPIDAILAFHRLIEMGHRDAILVMIGDGPLRGRLVALAHETGIAGSVRILGYAQRDEVWAWQTAADVLVNSSRSEGTPLALLEALGAGTPGVGYPLGGVEAALARVGGGLVASGHSPRDLAVALDEVLEGRWDRVQLAHQARRAFDIQVAARSIQAVYESVA
jgi:glycosyltransferase involved in cell wall biosynthesis